MYYNSRDTFYKNPFGAVGCGEKISFKIKGRAGLPAPYLCIQKEGGAEQHIPMTSQVSDREHYYCAEFAAPQPGLYFYCFKWGGGRHGIYNFGQGIGRESDGGNMFMQTVYHRDFKTPDRFKGGVCYQIFPDRFFHSEKLPFAGIPGRVYRKDRENPPFFKWQKGEKELINTDFYGGNLKGIREKLDYLENLGVGCIYLNPIFSAASNHRYDTADYMKIDRDLGSEEDFVSLCSACHARGIKVILDGVFSHTGSDSVYFNKYKNYGDGGAYNDVNSPYRRWFDFDGRYKHGYRCWWDFESLPEVNEGEESYIDFICGENGVIRHWLSLGADGFRLDVADELPDEFIEKIRQAVKSCGEDKLLIGEVWEDAVTKISFDKRRSYLLGKGLDSVMNYPFRTAVLDFIRNGGGDKFCQEIFSIYENYPKQALDNAWNSLSTHDTPRAITRLAADDPNLSDRYRQSVTFLSDRNRSKGEKMLMCAFALMFFLPGVPCIYYGDENAAEGYRDPFNRGYFDWENAGGDIYKNLKAMADFRKSHDCCKDGELYFAYISQDRAAFVRHKNGEEILAAVNRGNHRENFTYKGVEYTINPMDYFYLAL